MTPLNAIKLCSEIYTNPENFIIYSNKVFVGLKQIEDYDVFVFRGPINLNEWIDNFTSDVTWHNKLGYCNSQLLDGIDEFFEWSKSIIRENSKIILIGFNSGGGNARCAAGLFAFDGLPIDILITFGSPKPGYRYLKWIINNSKMIHLSYCHLFDLVPELFINNDYCHTEKCEIIETNQCEIYGNNNSNLLETYISALK